MVIAEELRKGTKVIAELRGEEAARAIPKILDAVATYPYANEYQLWPGPTFP